MTLKRVLAQEVVGHNVGSAEERRVGVKQTGEQGKTRDAEQEEDEKGEKRTEQRKHRDEVEGTSGCPGAVVIG